MFVHSLDVALTLLSLFVCASGQQYTVSVAYSEAELAGQFIGNRMAQRTPIAFTAIPDVPGHAGATGYAFIWAPEPRASWAILFGVDRNKWMQQVENDYRYRQMQVNQVCGYEENGHEKLVVFADQSWKADYKIIFHMPTDDTAESNRLLSNGYNIKNVCGWKVGGEHRFATVWAKSRSQPTRRAHYNALLTECAVLDFNYRQEGLMTTRFQVFQSGNGQILCTAIWERIEGNPQAQVQIGTNITAMVLEMQHRGMHPRQLSYYIDQDTLYFVLLWVSSFDVDRPQPLWTGKTIPMNYLAGSQDGFLVNDLRNFQTSITNFMISNNVHGVSIAVAKDEQLKLAVGFGYADIATMQELLPMHVSRIGSISKTVASVAVHKLIERGLLTLDDKVFGVGAILGTRFGSQPYSRRVQLITVRHLLEHTCGGWSDGGLTALEDLQPQLNASAWLSWQIDNVPLQSDPGARFAYSNTGYFVLSRVVEAVSGMQHADFCRRNIFAPSGVENARTATARLGSRYDDEAILYDHGILGDTYQKLPSRWSGNGEWVLNPTDLLRYMVRVDGFSRKPDILPANLIREMTEPTVQSFFTYAKGWDMNSGPRGIFQGFSGYWHGGTFPGLSSILFRSNDGYTVACFMNKRDYDLDYFSSGYEALLDFVRTTSVWPTHDLFNA